MILNSMDKKAFDVLMKEYRNSEKVTYEPIFSGEMRMVADLWDKPNGLEPIKYLCRTEPECFFIYMRNQGNSNKYPSIIDPILSRAMKKPEENIPFLLCIHDRLHDLSKIRQESKTEFIRFFNETSNNSIELPDGGSIEGHQILENMMQNSALTAVDICEALPKNHELDRFLSFLRDNCVGSKFYDDAIMRCRSERKFFDGIVMAFLIFIVCLSISKIIQSLYIR